MVKKASLTKASKQWIKYKESADKAISEGKYDLSESVLFAALMEAQDSFQPTDFRFIYTLEKLAQSLWFLGKFTEAVEHCQKLVDIHEKNATELDATDRLTFTIDLAMVYHTSKQFAQAEEAYKKAIQQSVQLFGENHYCTGKIRSLYADLLNTSGKQNEASRLGVAPKVVTINDWLASALLKGAGTTPPVNQGQRNLPPSPATSGASPKMPPPPPPRGGQAPPVPASPPAQASSLPPPPQKEQPEQVGALGRSPEAPKPADANALQVTFTREEAETIYLSNKETAEGNLEAGDVQFALRLLQINLKLLKHFGIEDALLAETLESLTQVKLQMGLHKDAIEYCKEAYELKMKALGPDDINVAHSASRLASIYYMVADYDNAVPLAKRCVDNYEKVHGEFHPYVAGSLHNLATLYHVQRKYAQAEQAYKRCMEIKNKVFGSDHPETARLLKSYAELLADTHREEEAKHMTSMATGMITGSWKAVDLPQADALTEPTETCCDICNTPMDGNDACPVCGFEPDKGRHTTSFGELRS